MYIFNNKQKKTATTMNAVASGVNDDIYFLRCSHLLPLINKKNSHDNE